MNIKNHQLTAAAGLIALVAACILAAARWIPDGGGFYQIAVPGFFILAMLAPLALGHLLVRTRTPVCRFGSACPKGRAFHRLLVAMFLIAAGALVALTVAGLAGLSGAPLAALVFCAAMSGALHTLVGPGFSFDWIPHPPAGDGVAGRDDRPLWILRPGGFSVRGSSKPPNHRAVFVEWAVWGLAMVAAYVPICVVALVPLPLGNALRVSGAAHHRWSDSALLSVAACIAFASPLVGRILFARGAGGMELSADSRRAGRGSPSAVGVLSACGAAVAVVSSILPMVPYWIGFLALLLTLTASEYAYFTSIFGNGTGLRWPGESVNR